MTFAHSFTHQEPQNLAAVLASHNFWETLWIFNPRIILLRILSVVGTPYRRRNEVSEKEVALVKDAGWVQGQVPGLPDQSSSRGLGLRRESLPTSGSLAHPLHSSGSSQLLRPVHRMDAFPTVLRSTWFPETTFPNVPRPHTAAEKSGKGKSRVLQTGAPKCHAQEAWPVGTASASPFYSLS